MFKKFLTLAMVVGVTTIAHASEPQREPIKNAAYHGTRALWAGAATFALTAAKCSLGVGFFSIASAGLTMPLALAGVTTWHELVKYAQKTTFKKPEFKMPDYKNFSWSSLDPRSYSWFKSKKA